MKTKILLTGALSFLMLAATVAQESTKRFGFELNTGVSIATGKPGDAALRPGFGFEGIFHYRFMPHTGIYAGWGWNRFGAGKSFAGSDVCFEETGYVFGVQFMHPVGAMPISYYLRAGGLYNHIEIENTSGDIIGDTGHGLGFQLAAGIGYAIGKNWSITPGIKFNYLSGDVNIEGVNTDIKHNYLSLRVGFLKRF